MRDKMRKSLISTAISLDVVGIVVLGLFVFDRNIPYAKQIALAGIIAWGISISIGALVMLTERPEHKITKYEIEGTFYDRCHKVSKGDYQDEQE